MTKTAQPATYKHLTAEALRRLRAAAEGELGALVEEQRKLSLRAVSGDEAALRLYHELAARARRRSSGSTGPLDDRTR